MKRLILVLISSENESQKNAPVLSITPLVCLLNIKTSKKVMNNLLLIVRFFGFFRELADYSVYLKRCYYYKRVYSHF